MKLEGQRVVRAVALCTLLLLAGIAQGCESKPAEHRSHPPPSSTAGAASEGTLAAGGVGYLELYTAAAKPGQTLPMILAIHGLGDRPERFRGLFRDLPVPTRLIVARGIDRYGRGFSWFPIRVGNVDEARLTKGVRHAANRLARMIEALVKRYPTRRRPLVTGFSQGGILSFALAAEHPQLIASAVPLAGWLPRPMWPAQAPAAAVPIVALHGDADRVLPIAPTRAAVAALRKLGMAVELHEYPAVVHTVSPAMRRALYREIAAHARR